MGKFEAGNKMSKGRPKGARNKGLLLLEKMQEQDLDTITSNLVELAKGGDFAAIALIVNRVYALPKAPSVVNLDLMNGIRTQTDINDSMTDLLSAVGAGDLDIDDAQELVKLIAAKAGSIQICQSENIEMIKEKLAQMQNK